MLSPNCLFDSSDLAVIAHLLGFTEAANLYFSSSEFLPSFNNLPFVCNAISRSALRWLMKKGLVKSVTERPILEVPFDRG